MLLTNVADRDSYHIWFNNRRGNEFVIEKPNRTIRFHHGTNGLYRHDDAQKDMVMVTTAKGNKEGHTRQQYKRGNSDQHTLGMVGYPSLKDFEKWYVKT